ncbi:MAG: HEAT repeat domain-containing protein [Thermomicrobium sp.]|nr:HEAT repeat domain-containing protein [Thermomicrobium sp.]MDW8059965.1 HEAT repeat domain-containing protein [Thermomicrobium sp.]
MRRNDDLRELFERLSQHFRATDVARLSDVPRSAIPVIRELWPMLPLANRRRIVDEMVELSEANIDLDFRRVLLVALDDPDKEVRRRAIEGLWEADETGVLHRFLARLETETEPEVRAALAQALGRFAELDVEGRLPRPESERLRGALRALLHASEPVEVRRRALESIAVYGDSVALAAIEEAYWSGDPALRVSAIYAMGRSLDRRWLPLLLDELRSDDPERRYEAATACGELGAEEAIDELIGLTTDPDRDVQGAAIAALGRIGGTIATNVLRRLARSADPVVRDAAEDALGEAMFASDPLRPTPW